MIHCYVHYSRISRSLKNNDPSCRKFDRGMKVQWLDCKAGRSDLVAWQAVSVTGETLSKRRKIASVGSADYKWGFASLSRPYVTRVCPRPMDVARFETCLIDSYKWWLITLIIDRYLQVLANTKGNLRYIYYGHYYSYVWSTFRLYIGKSINNATYNASVIRIYPSVNLEWCFELKFNQQFLLI